MAILILIGSDLLLFMSQRALHAYVQFTGQISVLMGQNSTGRPDL